MLLPPDVEAALVTLLPEASTKIPNPRPAAFTRVSGAGGPGPLNVKQTGVRVLVECFAGDEVAAFDRARHAWGLIWAAQRGYIGDVWVSRVELTNPVPLEDTATGLPRYQFVAQLTTTLQEATP